MCGIAGVLGERDPSLIKKMTDSLRHRGPDHSGYFYSSLCDLGVRRLRIVDMASGDQPIYNENGTMCVVFNGEIYNYKELRHRLVRKGHLFKTKTDTEVVVHLYEEYGDDCVKLLHGMFAFAIADNNKLFLARDRLGIKPLYFSHNTSQGLFVFASEIKALLRCAEIPVSVDTETLANVRVLGHNFGNRTFFSDIYSLEPGHTLQITYTNNRPQLQKKKYWELRIEPDNTLSLEQCKNICASLLKKAVKSHLQGDVPVCLALSGGLDSSILALEMSRGIGATLETFTVSGDDPRTQDPSYARGVAEYIQSKHHEVRYSFEDSLNDIPSLVLATEEPYIMNMAMFNLCREARGFKVCVIGEGADELFGGYYQQFIAHTKTISRMEQSLADAQKEGLPVGGNVVDYVRRMSYTTSDQHVYLREYFLANLTNQLIHRHLELFDKISMAFGLEIRLPYLDDALVDFANRIPFNLKINKSAGEGKYILKMVALSEYGTALASVVKRPKETLPHANNAFFAAFNDLCEKMVPDTYVMKHQYSMFFPNEQFISWGVGQRNLTLRAAKRKAILFDLFSFIFLEKKGVVPADFNFRKFIAERTKS